MAEQAGGRPPSLYCEGKNCPSTTDPDGPKLNKATHNATEKLEYFQIENHRAPLLTNTTEPANFGITLCPTCIAFLVCKCKIKYIPPSQEEDLYDELMTNEELLRSLLQTPFHLILLKKLSRQVQVQLDPDLLFQ